MENADTLEEAPSGIDVMVEENVYNNIRILEQNFQSYNLEMVENFTESNNRFEKIELDIVDIKKDIVDIKKSLSEVVSFMNSLLPTILAGNLGRNVTTDDGRNTHQRTLDAERLESRVADAAMTPIRGIEQHEAHNFRHIHRQENLGNESALLSEERPQRSRSSYFQNTYKAGAPSQFYQK